MVGHGRRTKVLAGAVAAGLTGLAAPALLAQETGGDGDTRASGLVFGLEQSLETGRNRGLSIPAGGTSTIATTRLSLSYFDRTEISSFGILAEGVLRFADTPGTDANGFADPALRLTYRREGANAGLSFSASVVQEDVAFLNDLSDFIGEDGEIDLPDDFDDFTGEGERTIYSAEAVLELRRQAPLGLTLSAGTTVTDYTNTTSATLFDETSVRVGAVASLRFSEISSATIGLGYEEADSDDPLSAPRQITSLDLGYARELSPRARMDASIGITQTERDIAGAATERATEAAVNLTYDLPTGELSGGIGLAWPDGGGSEVTGRLGWRQDLPTGSISAALTQELETLDDGETRPETALSLNYTHEINAVSGIAFDVAHVVAGSTATRNRVAQTEAGVSYSHLLTEDWSLRAGLRYQIRNEATVGQAESPYAFVTLGRSFDLR